MVESLQHYILILDLRKCRGKVRNHSQWRNRICRRQCSTCQGQAGATQMAEEREEAVTLVAGHMMVLSTPDQAPHTKSSHALLLRERSVLRSWDFKPENPILRLPEGRTPEPGTQSQLPGQHGNQAEIDCWWSLLGHQGVTNLHPSTGLTYESSVDVAFPS